MSDDAAPTLDAEETGRRPLRLDGRGRLDEDIPCRSCDYNLRGLLESDECPECATPVTRSTRPDLLRFSDPSWLNRLSRGMLLVVIGLLAGTVVAMILGGLAGGLRAVGFAGGTILGLSATIGMAFSLVTVAGVWLATTPEPGRPEPDGRLTIRSAARWCAMVQLAYGPLEMAGLGPGGSATGAGGFTMTTLFGVIMIIGSVLQVIAVLGQVAALVYLRRLAERLPAMKLARSTKIVTWGHFWSQMAAVVIGSVIMLLLPTFIGVGGGPAPATGTVVLAASGVGCAVAASAVVFSIWALVLLFRYRAAFTIAAEQSRSSWTGRI